MFRVCVVVLMAVWSSLPAPAWAGAWVPPTPEELRMGAPPDDPGANAVYLSYDEDDNDQRNDHLFSVRLKVLTQAGVEHYADVQIGGVDRHFSIQAVEGRTIHPDGTVIPFTGKPFVKTLKRRGETYSATVFSMPDVQVGSILEYRYRLAYADGVLLPAQWYVQHEAATLHAHYIFRPFNTSGSHFVVIDHGQTSKGLFYTSYLPRTAKIDPDNHVGHPYYELTVANVPPLPDEDALPPIHSLSYRMLFYYAAQLDPASYWNQEGKYLSKDINSFASPGPKLKSDVQGLVAGSAGASEQARKLYAAAMKIENTDFTRERSREEDSAQGLKAVKTAEDIWVRQRGSSDEIALTYLAMLRAAGIRAYGMRVTNRDRNLFEPAYIDTSQLDDTIIIASLDGKETFLDPGARFCPFGQLAWRHSWAQGIRQTDGGTAISPAGPLNYKDTALRRVAILSLTDTGEAHGTFTLTYTGQEAMRLRQRETGEASGDTKQRFEEEARRMLPGGMKLHVIEIKNLDDGEKPLQVTCGVNGPFGTASGHRLMVAAAPLREDEQPAFTEPTRKNAVYFHYPYTATDIVVLHLSPGIHLEAAPPDNKASALDQMAYTLQATSKDDTVQLTRTVAMNGVLLRASDYPKLREFFGNLHSADENPVLFTHVAAAGPAPGETTGGSEK